MSSGFDDGVAEGYVLGRNIASAITEKGRLRCWNCGAQLPRDARFCCYCGRRV